MVFTKMLLHFENISDAHYGWMHDYHQTWEVLRIAQSP